MYAKVKSPLWIIVIGCAFYITKCLISLSWPLIGIPAFGLIFVFDLIIITSAMVPQATVDECETYWVWMSNVFPMLSAFSVVFSMISGILFILAMYVCPWDSIEEMNKVDNVVNMHAHFAGLFMTFTYIKQFLLPVFRNH